MRASDAGLPKAVAHVPVKSATTPVTPSADGDCYAAPRGHTGAIAVVVEGSVRVEVDGRKVCGDVGRVGVAAGSHAVRVVDVATRREYVTTIHVDGGRVFKLVPAFR